MKGILFNLLEDVVVDQYGIDVWDSMIERSGATGSYTAVGDYRDDELTALVGGLGELCTAGRGTVGNPDVLRWFGRAAIAPLAERYPQFFAPHERTLDFVLTLNDVIHAEVLRLHPDAQVPTFHFSGIARGDATSSVTLHYNSERALCALAEGFVSGAAHHFGELSSIRQRTCMFLGQPECTIVCTFGMLDPERAPTR